MIKINLAPEYIPDSNPASLYFGLGVFVVVVGLFYYVPVWYADRIVSETAEIRTKTEEKKNQLSKLKLDVEKINSLKAKLVDVKNRAQRIRVLGADRKQPVLFLDKLQTVHLDRMWLVNLELGTKPSKVGELNNFVNEVVLKGNSFDHSIVSEYAKRIKSEFQNAGLESANGYQNYIPAFLEGNEKPFEYENASVTLSKKVKQTVKEVSVTPIKILDLKLKLSKSEFKSADKERVPINNFEITLNTNIKMD
jgi:hypothetical protein